MSDSLHSRLLARLGPRPDRPHVRVEPGKFFGAPHIRGISVEAAVGMLWAGETAETVAEEYGLTRAELLLAAWFSARHGPIHHRQRWREWLKRWEPVLWRGGYDPAEVPLPTEVDHG